MSKDRKFSSVWDAIESTPQQAANMRARSELMMALQEWVKDACKTQGQGAKLFGITQPRMSNLMRGRLHLFFLGTLMDMATTAGMESHIAIKRRKTKLKARSRRTGSVRLLEVYWEHLRSDD